MTLNCRFGLIATILPMYELEARVKGRRDTRKEKNLGRSSEKKEGGGKNEKEFERGEKGDEKDKREKKEIKITKRWKKVKN